LRPQGTRRSKNNQKKYSPDNKGGQKTDKKLTRWGGGDKT